MDNKEELKNKSTFFLEILNNQYLGTYNISFGSSSICIESKRVFGVNGIHEVRFFNNNDSIVFKHEALSRNIFSEGALAIAKSIIKKEPNLYSVKDFFN